MDSVRSANPPFQQSLAQTSVVAGAGSAPASPVPNTTATPDSATSAGDRSLFYNLPNCPRRVWGSHSYCGRTHAIEHAALVSSSLALRTDGLSVLGDNGTDATVSAEVAAQFFQRTVEGAVRSTTDDATCATCPAAATPEWRARRLAVLTRTAASSTAKRT